MFDFLPSPLDYAAPFLIVLTALVYVHEMGHYLVARWNGVRVEVFSIGFGPEIYGWNNKAGTRWKISAIPLGGYVKMFGEGDMVTGIDDVEDREMTEEEKKVSFHHKRLKQRVAIVFAGPLANFIFAAVLFAGIFTFVGSPVILSGIGTVQAGSAAEAAGIKQGDRIVAIDDKDIATFEDIRAYISESPGKNLTIHVERDGRAVSLRATPKSRTIDAADGPKEIGLLGVTPDPNQVSYDRHNPLTATWMGVERTVSISGQILYALGEIISGKRTAEELGGPLRIAKFSGDVAQGGVLSLIFFMAALSINLGLINLFPIPVLDGGHLVFYAIEGIRGRPLGVRAQEYGLRIGFALVMTLIVFATWNDLVQLKVFEFLKNLVT